MDWIGSAISTAVFTILFIVLFILVGSMVGMFICLNDWVREKFKLPEYFIPLDGWKNTLKGTALGYVGILSIFIVLFIFGSIIKGCGKITGINIKCNPCAEKEIILEETGLPPLDEDIGEVVLPTPVSTKSEFEEYWD